MKSSQLALEFNSMADRRELYAKFGLAAEAAQLFETELGTLLLALRGLEKNWHVIPDREAAQQVLDGIVGKLLKDLQRHIAIDGNLETLFCSALNARNRLMHGFFEKRNFKIQSEAGRTEMIEDLDDLHGEVFSAWQSASILSGTFTAAMQILKP